MDKQKDFEKGWEEYKAKSKREVEEIGQDIADICSDMTLNCCGSTPCYACIAKRLKRKGYRKIPENAVVLTKEEYEKLKHFEHRVRSGVCMTQKEWFDFCNEDSNRRTCLRIEEREKERKETAEKFAERLKASKTIKAIFGEGWIFSYVEVCKEIDEICKEILEGKNAKNEYTKTSNFNDKK